MHTMDLFEIRERFLQDGTLICFSGPFSHSIIEELALAIRRHLESEALSKASLMDVFSIFVEQAQNIRNYASTKTAADAPPGGDFNQGIVAIGRKDDRFIVRSGNLVVKADLAGAVALIERLRGLDAAQKKALYREQLRKEKPEGALGAGLGLIDMARKSTQPLHYELRDLDGKYAFFSLQATI